MAIKNEKKLVVSSTPLRISFVGGGTDFPKFYKKHGGSFISSTIDKETIVTVKRHGSIFEENYRLNYSSSEITHELKEIRNEIARECIKLTGTKPPIFVNTISDLPEKSGLGSSSSFCVGLLNALFELNNEKINKEDLVKAAIEVEINILGKPIGIQDHYAATYGGLNYFHVSTSGKVLVEPIKLNENKINKMLFKNFLLFWTKIQRSSSDILTEQNNNTEKNISDLLFIKNQCPIFWDLLNNNFEIQTVGKLIKEGWEKKINLSSKITNTKITSWYEKAINNGALGGKLLGAGGGGFILIVSEYESRENIKHSLNELLEIEVNYNPKGSRILLVQ
tara:strand:- start:1112 stop:2119 length:1008 start_codon:yes stop_codon:yes gene_type:complete